MVPASGHGKPYIQRDTPLARRNLVLSPTLVALVAVLPAVLRHMIPGLVAGASSPKKRADLSSFLRVFLVVFFFNC